VTEIPRARPERRLLWTWAVIVFTLLVTIGRSLRLPNEFAMTHWLFDYRFGFMKRALVGASVGVVTNLAGVPLSPTGIATLSFGLLVAFFGVLLMVLFRATRSSAPTPEGVLVALVFVSSPFTVLSAHLVGYFDGLVYLLAALAIALVLSDRPGSSAFVSIVGLLVHENYLLIGLPLVALAATLVSAGNGRPSPRRRALVALLPPVLAFGLISLALAPGRGSDLQVRWVDHVKTVAFLGARAQETVVWNTTPPAEFWGTQASQFLRRLTDPGIFGPGLPALLTVLAFAHGAYRVRPASRVSFLMLAGVLSPLLLHLVAWDSVRIAAYPTGGALLALWILASTRGAVEVGNGFRAFALVALMANIFVRVPLMDGEVDRLTNGPRLLLYGPALLIAARAALEGVRRGRPSDRSPGPLLS
jgi:hypothetical protein